MSDSVYETLKQAAIDHIHAYDSPNPWDYNRIQSFRTADCVHYLRPVESLKAPFNAGISPPQFKQATELFAPVFDKSYFDVKEVAVDTQLRLVTVRIQASFDFKAFGDEPAKEGYTAEYIIMTEHNEAGKIVRIEEYMDTQRLMGYVEPRAERYLAYMAEHSG